MRVAIYALLIGLTVVGLGKTFTHGTEVKPERETAVVVETHTYEDQDCHVHDLVYVETEDGNVNCFDQSGFAEGDEVWVLIDEDGNYDKLQRR